MATATRTKDVRDLAAGEMTVTVRRPMLDHPRTVYGTFHRERRAHFVVERDRLQTIPVSYRISLDEGMLVDLLRRAASNKSGVSTRGPATAQGGAVKVDERGIPALVRDAANAKSRKATDGPLVAKVRLLDVLEPYAPNCRHCERPGAEHEHVAAAATDYLGRQHDAWWCVPQDVPGACQVCAAAPEVACEHDCPERERRARP